MKLRKLALFLAIFTMLTAESAFGDYSPCDLNQSGAVDYADVQAAVAMGVGLIPCTSLVYKPGVCGIVVVQRVVNAAQGKACVVGTGGQHYVILTWVASTTPDVSYKVLRADVAGGPYSQVSASPIVGLTYTDALVLAGRSYYYVVRAVDAAGNESVNSNEASGTIPSP